MTDKKVCFFGRCVIPSIEKLQGAKNETRHASIGRIQNIKRIGKFVLEAKIEFYRAQHEFAI